MWREIDEFSIPTVHETDAYNLYFYYYNLRKYLLITLINISISFHLSNFILLQNYRKKLYNVHTLNSSRGERILPSKQAH